MARIAYPSTDSLSDEVRANVGTDAPNVTRMLAHASPPVFEAVTTLLTSLMMQSSLDPKLRELAILRVGYISNAAYELFQHEPFGRFVGLTDAQLAAIKAGDAKAGVFDAAQSAVLELVDDVVANVRASDATLENAARHLGNRELVEVILITGQYMAVCRFLETTGVDLDEAAVDWDDFTAQT